MPSGTSWGRTAATVSHGRPTSLTRSRPRPPRDRRRYLVAFDDEQGERTVGAPEVVNNRDTFLELLGDPQDGDTRVALEATYGWEWLAELLEEAGYVAPAPRAPATLPGDRLSSGQDGRDGRQRRSRIPLRHLNRPLTNPPLHEDIAGFITDAASSAAAQEELASVDLLRIGVVEAVASGPVCPGARAGRGRDQGRAPKDSLAGVRVITAGGSGSARSAVLSRAVTAPSPIRLRPGCSGFPRSGDRPPAPRGRVFRCQGSRCCLHGRLVVWCRLLLGGLEVGVGS